MNKGRTDVDNFALSKPTWEIMKIISEITDFCWEKIFGAIFRPCIYLKLWKTLFPLYSKRSQNCGTEVVRMSNITTSIAVIFTISQAETIFLVQKQNYLLQSS